MFCLFQDYDIVKLYTQYLHIIIKMSEVKQWKESCRMQTKKLATLQKQFSKMLPFSMTTDLKPLIESWMQDQQQKTNQRFKQEASIFNKLSSMKRCINQLRETLKFYEKKDNYLIKIQNISQAIINKMDSFKKQMALDYEKYANIEELINKDLDIFEIKVTQYQKGETVLQEPIRQKANMKPKQNQQKQEQIKKIESVKVSDNQGIQKTVFLIEDQMRELTREVEDVDLQIRNLGRNLGWPQQDHNYFIMLWNRRKNNNYFQFQQECFEHLKTYTMDQIRTHFQKQKKFLQLQDARRQHLYEYKLKKQKKKQLQLQLIERKEKQQKIEANKVKREIDKAKEEKQTKQKLQNWKLMKEAQKEAQERERQMQELRKKQQIFERRKQVQEKKAVVAQWKQIKEATIQYKQKQVPKRPRSAVNKQTLQRIKKKQDEFLLKKMDLLRTKQQKESEKIKKQQMIKQKKFVEFNHIKSKLQEKTTTIKQKQRAKFDGSNPKIAQTFGGNLGIHHVRAVPSWRQGI